MTEAVTLTRPDDWHLHLRDGAAMAAVLPATAAQFARAIEDYLERETAGIAKYVNELNEHSPFKDAPSPSGA